MVYRDSGPILRNPRLVPDDLLLRLGTDNDIVLLNRSTALAADTALTNALVGTVVSEALAANSFIGSNITAAGDYALYGNRGGNSEQFLFMDVSTGVLYLSPYAGGLMLAMAADPPAPDNAFVHIWNGTAGGVTAMAGSLLVLEAAANTFISILIDATTRSAGLVIGAGATNKDAWVLMHDTASDVMDIGIAGSRRVALGTATLAFQQAETISSTSVGQLIFNGGLMIGVNAAANQIDDASNGAGSTTTYIGNASINVTSDMRVKDNFTEFHQGLDLIRRLRVQEFDYKDLKPFGGYDGRNVGFTAQHLHQIAPWAVNTQGGADCLNCLAGFACEHHLPWQARQEFLMGPVVQAIQEIDHRLAALEK